MHPTATTDVSCEACENTCTVDNPIYATAMCMWSVLPSTVRPGLRLPDEHRTVDPNREIRTGCVYENVTAHMYIQTAGQASTRLQHKSAMMPESQSRQYTIDSTVLGTAYLSNSKDFT